MRRSITRFTSLETYKRSSQRSRTLRKLVSVMYPRFVKKKEEEEEMLEDGDQGEV